MNYKKQTKNDNLQQKQTISCRLLAVFTTLCNNKLSKLTNEGKMIGEQIKKLRIQFDLKQKDLAQKLGVSTGAVGLWELNKRVPDYTMLLKLAKEFNVTVDYLLTNKQDNEIIILGRNGDYKKFTLSEKDLKSIETLAESLSEIDKLDK